MISKYDVIKSFEKAAEKGKALAMKLSEDKTKLLDSKTGEYVCSVDTFLDYLRKEEHCNFETVYCEHVSLDHVYRCKDCGTVIFGGDDERYDPNCRCPTCCNDKSVCRNEFWTADEIKNDPEKSREIEALEQVQKAMNEAAQRRKARGGLYDWQRWVKHIKTKNHHIDISYLNFGWGNKDMKQNKYIEIQDFEKDSDGSFVYGGNKGHLFRIPLNFYTIYLFYIFPYSNKCPKEMRKYHFWQRTPIALT